LVNRGGCDTNAICTNEIGSFSCTCNPEYSGDGFTCFGNLQIMNFQKWFWFFFFYSILFIIFPQKKKLDIDECLTNNGGCNEHATCTNTIGSRECECNEGYSGDGLSCSLLTKPTTFSTENQSQNGQAVGIGVGVSVSLLALILLALLILFLIKRRNNSTVCFILSCFTKSFMILIV